MIYSKECEYAIRAMTYLAQHQERRCQAKEISEKQGLPHHFLSKILQTLTREKLLNSAKGPNGGFVLARPDNKITLFHIKAIIDGVDDLSECAVGLAKCNDKMPCPLHDDFTPIREQVKTYLKETSLADMTAALKKKAKSA
jgi:Rrf2 family protein